jgi:AraC-like DNA-binding protein
MPEKLKQAILRYIGKHERAEGVTVTPVNGLYLVKHSSPSELEHTLARPLVCLVLQGCKRVCTSSGELSYAAGATMIVTSHVPEASRISNATPVAPYLAVALDLDPTVLTDLLISAQEIRSSKAAPETGEELLDAFRRLVLLLDRPEPLAMLKDGLIREIHYWLLLGRRRAAIRNLGLPDSQARRIARAVAILRADYTQPVQIERLAAAAGMSRSAFHQHFRAITLLSPLQFQKKLRLIEARRLILKGNALSQVAFRVGYVSASQFSREYTRMYGQTPSVDKKATSDRWGKGGAGESIAARFGDERRRSAIG